MDLPETQLKTFFYFTPFVSFFANLGIGAAPWDMQITHKFQRYPRALTPTTPVPDLPVPLPF